MASIATHNGPFHADDVMAVALLHLFWNPDAQVVRTRDPARIDEADVVVDVGGVFDPSRGRFDHHQASYTGPRSSAGMVLDWLEAEGRVSPGLAQHLRDGCMNNIDDVDNGREAPRSDVLCFSRVVDALGQPASDHASFDQAFLRATEITSTIVDGIRAGYDKAVQARTTVEHAMAEAVEHGRNVLFFDDYVPWKAPYFELGGATHPTEFVLFPSTDGSWRIVAIPPELGAFAQKRSLPEAWAGLTDEALEAVTGIPGSVFCHKNRFIAVFKTREGALQALRDNALLER